MSAHDAPRPATLPARATELLAPCGAPRTRGRGTCQVLTPGGRPCRSHRPGADRRERVWTPVRIARLESLLEDGLTDRAAADRLGLTADAVTSARRRYGFASRAQILLDAGDVARLLGRHRSTVTRWTDAGWIESSRQPGQGGAHRLYTRGQVIRFLEDAAHWHRWDPLLIPDAQLRAYALAVRGDVRYLTYAEAAVLMCCAPVTIRHWVAQGRLPVYRERTSYVREDELRRMPLPEIGQARRKRGWAPCCRCGDLDGPVPRQGRTPGRRDGRPYGYEGRLCETCYARLRSAACKQRQKEAA